MEFRWMTSKEDLKDAYAIRIKVFCDEQGYSPDQELDDTDTAPDTWHVVLYQDGKPVATGRIYWKAPGVIGLGRIAVKKAWRGRGIGALMVEEMNRKAALLGAGVSQLDAQKRAAGFYEKQGYHICGEEHMDGHVPHIMMEKPLYSDKLS